MFPELGHFALILAFSLALIQSSLPLLGVLLKRPSWWALAKPAALGHAFFIGFSYCCLTLAFINNDFSVAYVAENSFSQLPLVYRIAAVWGAHEGSMLLWVMLLGLWTVAVCLFSKSLPKEMLALILAVLGMISVGFLLFLITTSSPFVRLLPNVPADGQDLNPLLQDPGMAIHPPMLYMGYVGFAVAFAFAIAALIQGRLDASWARWTRPWTQVAWCFLTLGITLGSGWAYRVLGWGGWWFWDPVENASFLPWLTGTALLHSLIVVEKRNAFKTWTALLAICAFSLSLMGTFLVRSGILTSVHAFASDPARGAFMLKFLTIVVGSSFALFAWRAPTIRGEGHFQLLSRETLLLSNNIILMVMMATVLLGTLYPLLLDAMGIDKISVGAPYFNTVFVPLMTLLMILMGIGPLCRWQAMPTKLLFSQTWHLLLLAMALSISLPLLITRVITFSVILGVMLASWVILATFQDLFNRSKVRGGVIAGLARLSLHHYGMMLAHLGIAICAIGITLSTAYHQERYVRMGIGETVQVGAYRFNFVKTLPIEGPNYRGEAGEFTVIKHTKPVTKLMAEKRIYIATNSPMTKAAIAPGLWRDLYLALGERFSDGSWSVRIYYKPFIRWIWGGGILMILGGVLASFDKRYR